MPHSSTVTLLSYWRGLQSSPDKAPLRERFDPARLKGLIPQMLMVSDGRGDYRFRLAGGFLTAFHGYELKDTSLLNLFRSPFIGTVRTGLIMSRRREQPLLLTLSANWQSHDALPEFAQDFTKEEPSRSETVTFEVCLCPLTNFQGQVDRFVGIYQTLTPAPKNPRGTIGRFSLISSRVLEPQHSIKPGHLRLVVDDGKRIA